MFETNSLSLSRYLQSLAFQKINRAITAIDSQPTFDGGVLISVLGRLQVSRPTSSTVKISLKSKKEIFRIIFSHYLSIVTVD